MTTIEFKEAKPVDTRAIICIAGSAGSGKTASALRLAAGIVNVTGGTIFFADTENKRALKYSRQFKFEHYNFMPPFNAERYQEVVLSVDKVAKPGSVLIIDSTSHEHEGPGGALEQAEAYLDKHTVDKNGQTDWKKREKLTQTAWILPKEARRKFINNALQRSNCYIILLFRAKEKSKLMKGADGKTEMVNLGIKVIGAEDYAYESDVIFVLPPGSKGHPDWEAKTSRINDMGGELIAGLKAIPQINEEMGRMICRYFSVAKAGPDKAAIVNRLEGAAKLGSEAMRAEYAKLKKEEKDIIKDELPRLQKLVAVTDKPKAEEKNNES